MGRFLSATITLLVAVVLLEVGSQEESDNEQEPVASAPQSAWVAERSPAELDAAMRGCRGPSAVFVSSGPCALGRGCGGSSEAASFTEFEGAAEMFAGVACFSTVRCDLSPRFCADHNLRRTPAVIVYPRGAGSVQILTAKLDKQEIATWIAKPISAADRAFLLNADNIDIFLRDSLRPLKLILFSSRKTTPIILQALSSDMELWPHVHFGFVKHSESSILEEFKVTEVPRIVLQQGSDRSTREVFTGGEMTIDALRTWIRSRVEATTVDPGEDGIFRAVEGADLFEEEMLEAEDPNEEEDDPDLDPDLAIEEPASSSQASSSPRKPGVGNKPGASRKPGSGKSPVPKTGRPEKKSSSRYTKLARGAEGCPPGREITSVEECMKACNQLGLRAKPPWISTYPGLPRFCSMRERPSDDDQERMHFNSSPEGQGRADLSPICRAPEVPRGSASASDSNAQRTRVPELNAASKDALLGSEGFCLVYLREGQITEEEIAMLVDLEQQFRPQLEHQGTHMRWMWMDLHSERKLKAFFDPPVLPSALVLNPHKRPRFAMAKHSEDHEGDPMPIDQPAIALLLNTVLGGDAQFSSLPPKALTKFAEQ